MTFKNNNLLFDLLKINFNCLEMIKKITDIEFVDARIYCTLFFFVVILFLKIFLIKFVSFENCFIEFWYSLQIFCIFFLIKF